MILVLDKIKCFILCIPDTILPSLTSILKFININLIEWFSISCIHPNHLKVLSKHRLPCPGSKASDLLALVQGLKNSISNNFPDYIDVTDLGTTLLEVLI